VIGEREREISREREKGVGSQGWHVWVGPDGDLVADRKEVVPRPANVVASAQE
jgi:hypothetical protein